jgi:hypothetical protein
MQGMVTASEQTVEAVLDRMQQRIDAVPAANQHRRIFAGTYRRTTKAVGTAIDDARFEDPRWVERWDVVFADLYLAAYDAHTTDTTDTTGTTDTPDAAGAAASVPRPWRLAFDAPADLPPLRHVLLGINAHVNYDLPQALLAVISDEDFLDPVLMARRRRDHERIDAVLASRVAAEDNALGGSSSLLDRMLAPLNRLGSKRFLREARQKVWRNVEQLQSARLKGDDAYRRRLAELEVLSAAKIADLLAPGQVLIRLALTGFGVVLPPS